MKELIKSGNKNHLASVEWTSFDNETDAIFAL